MSVPSQHPTGTITFLFTDQARPASPCKQVQISVLRNPWRDGIENEHAFERFARGRIVPPGTCTITTLPSIILSEKLQVTDILWYL